jgi:hypothetical protein
MIYFTLSLAPRNKAKQDAMKKKSPTEKREDLCEMLGRGC